MKTTRSRLCVFIALLAMSFGATGEYQLRQYGYDRSQSERRSHGRIIPDAYGPGIGMDRTGLAIRQDQPGLRLRPGAYGPGSYQDQYGRELKIYRRGR